MFRVWNRGGVGSQELITTFSESSINLDRQGALKRHLLNEQTRIRFWDEKVMATVKYYVCGMTM